MRCPSCQTTQTLKQGGMTCQACGYAFLFFPKAAHGMSDSRLQFLVNKASYNDTRFFSLKQLYNQYLIHFKSKAGPVRGIGCVFTIMVGAILFEVSILWALLAFFSSFCIFFLTPLARVGERGPMDLDAFDRDIVRYWEENREPLSRLIREPGLHSLPDGSPFDDVYDYGVERVIIVEHDLMVDLLVRNGWHAENKALILSENMYPSYVGEQAKKLLADQSDLPVLLLHDATPEGEAMQARILAGAALPLVPDQVKDLGFSRSDVLRMPRFRHWRDQHGGMVPLDAMMYGTLAIGLATAVAAGGLAIAETLGSQGAAMAGGAGAAGMDFG